MLIDLSGVKWRTSGRHKDLALLYFLLLQVLTLTPPPPPTQKQSQCFSCSDTNKAVSLHQGGKRVLPGYSWWEHPAVCEPDGSHSQTALDCSPARLRRCSQLLKLLFSQQLLSCFQPFPQLFSVTRTDLLTFCLGTNTTTQFLLLAPECFFGLYQCENKLLTKMITSTRSLFCRLWLFVCLLDWLPLFLWTRGRTHHLVEFSFTFSNIARQDVFNLFIDFIGLLMVKNIK